MTNPRLASVLAHVERNREFYELQSKAKRAKSAKRHRDYSLNRRKTDVAFRLLGNLRGRIYAALKGKQKSKRTPHLIGCTIAELKAHIERQFTEGMSWENYGQWHIDHIKPCCMFNLLDESEQSACFHFSNLQPMWAMDNFRKNGRRIGR